jgi:hypothetical protein
VTTIRAKPKRTAVSLNQEQMPVNAGWLAWHGFSTVRNWRCAGAGTHEKEAPLAQKVVDYGLE